ncbi:MAG: hypothetical protein H0T85_06380, partial [Geodermatophilaceae bacterium]|nr:hypothetical protein [Geodermatophilaceae bacterium]
PRTGPLGRLPGWPVLLAPLLTGWLVATFVALTMHGYWWPGRQVVVVLPLAALVVLWWVARLSRVAQLAAAALAGWGVLVYAVVLAHGLTGRTTWVGAPDRLALHAPLWWVLPDDRVLALRDVALYVGWTTVLAAAAVLAVRRERAGLRTSPARTSDPPSAATATADRRSRSAPQG